MPQVAWEFSRHAEVSVEGWTQGAALRFGRGASRSWRGAMFTAQLAGPQRLRVGMNSPDAPRTPQFLLNVLHGCRANSSEVEVERRTMN